MLLEWNKDLIKEADRSGGSTPLHLAASWRVISLLLSADPSAAYQPDKHGSFPIHMAATTDRVWAINVLLDTRHDTAELCDAMGRTFLLVAVQEESRSVVTYACSFQGRKFPSSVMKFPSSVMNMQDDNGDTALHIAVTVGNIRIFNRLMQNRFVALNLTNNMGHTSLDVSWTNMPAGFKYGLVTASERFFQNDRRRMHTLLLDAGAQTGTYRLDLFHKKYIRRPIKEKEEDNITTSTQIVGIGAVLIATVAFAAAFTLPGGYRGDDHENGGTPMLVGHSAFHVFIIADTLAFILSGLSVSMLIFARIADIGIGTRKITLAGAVAAIAASARCLSAAFAFGLYVVLAPVARTTAVASFAITALAFVDALWFILLVCNEEMVPLMRLGARAWTRLAGAIALSLLGQFWPYIVIAGVVKCVKIKSDH